MGVARAEEKGAGVCEKARWRKKGGGGRRGPVGLGQRSWKEGQPRSSTSVSYSQPSLGLGGTTR